MAETETMSKSVSFIFFIPFSLYLLDILFLFFLFLGFVRIPYTRKGWKKS